MSYNIKEFVCPDLEDCGHCEFVLAYKKFFNTNNFIGCGTIANIINIKKDIQKHKGEKITNGFFNKTNLLFEGGASLRRIALWHLTKGYTYIGEGEKTIIQEEMDI